MQSLRKMALITGMFVLLSLVPAHLLAADYYIAQSAAGSADGTSCANAYAYTWFNSAGHYTAGDTIHLCGTITGGTLACSDGTVLCSKYGDPCGSSGGVCVNYKILSLAASGTPSDPITVKWESGAKVSAPASGNRGLVSVRGASNIIFDGGAACGWINGTKIACNGIIENTANGDALTYHSSTIAISDEAMGCSNIEIRNLTFQNLYLRDGDAQNTTSFAATAFRGSVTGYVSIHNCTFGQVGQVAALTAVDTTGIIRFYNNYMDDVGTGVAGGLETLDIHDNYFGSMSNYDTAINSFCTSSGVPYACCTGKGLGNCPPPNMACKAAGNPIACCTGYLTGTCANGNAACTGNGTPLSCCTGSGTGYCPGFGNNSCIASSNPWSCCTGKGTGYCPEYAGGTGCNVHQDGIHTFPGTGHTISGNIYNNAFVGEMGRCPTGNILIETGDPNANHNISIFNNLFIGSSTDTYTAVSGAFGNDCSFYNNTWIAGNPTRIALDAIFGTGTYFKNNLMSGFGTFIAQKSGTFASGGLNNNIYVGGASGTPFTYNGKWYSFSEWQSATGQDRSSTTPTSAYLYSSGALQSNSPAVGAGANLTSLEITALNSDISAALRPATSAWDVGAYQFSGALHPPVNLNIVPGS